MNIYWLQIYFFGYSKLALRFLLLYSSVEESSGDLESGVNLVTELSNNLIPKLLHEISLKHENVIIGPFGIASNLAMLAESSSGKTRQEIFRALNITISDLEGVRVGFKAYCELFLEHSSQSEAAGTFSSVAISSTHKILPALKSILSRNYCANVTNINLNGNNTGSLEARTVALTLQSDSGVLSHWKDYEKIVVYTFLSHQAVVPFYKGDKSVVHVPMIPQVGLFKNARLQEYKTKAVIIPLEAKLANLLVLIPDADEDMKNLIKHFSKINLSKLIQQMELSEQEVFIPQLATVSKGLDLTQYLRRIGIRLALDSTKADLSRAGDKNNNIFLKEITQNAYFSTSFTSLNSVAAASTKLSPKARTKRNTDKIFIDRPFLFFVVQKDTNLAILAGKIGKPSQIPV